jgi:hypothetical protein
LPTIHTGQSLIPGTPEQWKNFYRNHHIAVTDIITSLNDADPNDPTHLEMVKKFKDDQLATFDIESTNIPTILDQHSTIQQVCITRNSFPNPWDHLFQPTFDFVANHPDRNIQIKRLRSPSRGARKGVTGNFTDYIANHWQEIGDYQIL